MLCSPLIALLTSNGADVSADRNGLNFADMLAPFCTTQVTVKDPIGQQVNTILFFRMCFMRQVTTVHSR
uniref:Uncharacterized protein n=1 Tax=Ditylenchus dipsaci TaxID=166011 RepID=A0A915DZF0_9BILA